MTNPNPFSNPGAPTSTQVKIADYENCLLIVRPRQIIEGITTPYGPKSATGAALHILDGRQGVSPDTPLYEPEILIFQGFLQGQLRTKIDPSGATMVLGRLGRGQAKAGQTAPFIIIDPTEQDSAAAMHWHQRHGQNLPALPPLITAQPQQVQQQAAPAQTFNPQAQYAPAPTYAQQYQQPPAQPQYATAQPYPPAAAPAPVYPPQPQPQYAPAPAAAATAPPPYQGAPGADSTPWAGVPGVGNPPF